MSWWSTMLLYISNYQIPTIAIYQASIVSDVNVHCIVVISSLCCMCHGEVLSHPLPCASGGTPLWQKNKWKKSLSLFTCFSLIKKKFPFLSFVFFHFFNFFFLVFFKDYLFLGCLITTLLFFSRTFKRFQH